MGQLTKDELLAKAKEMYPIRTKFKSEISNVTGCVIDEPHFDGDDIYINSINKRILMIYCADDDKWATIISTPIQHDGYISTYDIKHWGIKKGQVYFGVKKEGSHYVYLECENKHWTIPYEIVETWEKAIKQLENRGHVYSRAFVDFDDYFNETFNQ